MPTCMAPGCNRESYGRSCHMCHQSFCSEHFNSLDYLCFPCQARKQFRKKKMLAWFSVDEQTAVIVYRWGRFHHVALAGLNDKAPFVDELHDIVDLKTKAVELARIDAMTHEHIRVGFQYSLHYAVDAANVRDAYFQSTNPFEQMFSVIQNATLRQAFDFLYEQIVGNRQQFEQRVLVEAQEVAQRIGHRIERLIITQLHVDSAIVQQYKRTAQDLYHVGRQVGVDREKAIQEAMTRLATMRIEMEGWIARARELTMAATDRRKMRKQATIDQMRMETEALQQRIEMWLQTLRDATAAFSGIPGMKREDTQYMALLIQYLEALRQGDFQSGQTLNYLGIIDSILANLRATFARGPAPG